MVLRAGALPSHWVAFNHNESKIMYYSTLPGHGSKRAQQMPYSTLNKKEHQGLTGCTNLSSLPPKAIFLKFRVYFL